MEKNENSNSLGTRKLVANFDKRRLHSSIMLHMRRMKIPMNMIGADILKGVIFGIIRHPEISLDKAIENAIENAKLPGNSLSIDDGYDYIMEVIELASKSGISKRSPEQDQETILEVVNKIITEIDKEFCYEVAVKTMEENFGIKKVYSIGGEIIKCMLFKRIYAPASTRDCMLQYALKKVGAEIDEELTLQKALEYISPISAKEEVNEEDLFDLIKILEEFAYKNNNFF